MSKYVVQEFGRNIDGVIKFEDACSWQDLNSYHCIHVYKTPKNECFLAEEDARLRIVFDLLNDYGITDASATAIEMLYTDLGTKLYEILGEFYG